MEEVSYIDAAFSQGFFKVFLVLVALLAARVMVQWMDSYVEKSDSYWATWFRGISDECKIMYYSARWIGVCIAIAGSVS